MAQRTLKCSGSVTRLGVIQKQPEHPVAAIKSGLMKYLRFADLCVTVYLFSMFCYFVWFQVSRRIAKKDAQALNSLIQPQM